MHDRPTAAELLEAVQHFLEHDVVPALEGTAKFHARVAANVLGIVRRELSLEDEQLKAEWNSLCELLGSRRGLDPGPSELRNEIRQLTRHLCEKIQAGEADSGPWSRDVLRHVRSTVVAKLAVANPKLLGADSGGV